MFEWIVGAAALVSALAFLGTRVVRPSIRLVNRLDETLPLVARFVAVFGDSPESLNVLAEIAAQFKTDSGTTLRDVVNRLERAAVVTEATVSTLAAQAKVAAELAELDRSQLARLVALLDALQAKAEVNQAATDRAGAGVQEIIEDRAATQARADAVDVASAEPGTAADVGIRSDPGAGAS